MNQTAGKTASDVRDDLIDAFRRDVFGPDTRPEFHESHMSNREVINDTRPSSFYLLGYLTPADGSTVSTERDDAEELRSQKAQDDFFNVEEDDENRDAAGDDENGGSEAKQRKRLTPSSMGLTVFVDLDCPKIDVTLRYADYIAEPPIPEAVLNGDSQKLPSHISWHRSPQCVDFEITKAKLAEAESTPGGISIPLLDTASPQRKGGVLQLHVIVQKMKMPRPDAAVDGLSVTVFIVNRRPEAQRFRDVSNVFQVGLSLKTPSGFIGNPDMSGYDATDPDLRLHDLHYHDVLRFAGGRNTGTGRSQAEDGRAGAIWTDPLPSADVEKVDQNDTLDSLTEFSMLGLAELTKDGERLAATLESFPADYAKFINEQEAKAAAVAFAPRRKVAEELVTQQQAAHKRMLEGIALLRVSPTACKAFEAMNFAINSYLEKRGVSGAKWRPFQLAFILLNLNGLSEKTHLDRETVDLLFFPTGGGKTEAYLGLAAYQIAYRRLTHADWMGSGVSVIMRYTLRLLTLDQLGRAAAMICALELLRRSPDWHDENNQPLLGLSPIEIGLWVGSAATPNLIGGRGQQDSGRRHAYTKVNDYRANKGREAPAPIKECPWCQTPFGKNTFHVSGKRMLIRCENLDCDFSAERGGLPVLAVDEEIYNRLPAFIVGTVDKFAALPRRGEVGRFFDHVDRISETDDPKHTRFYGADEPGIGFTLNDHGECLPPPDLIIQDELHLISGPLGTIAGLYEAAIDRLSSRKINGKLRGPKIVASTATVRRAKQQIGSLFGRDETAIFPPPGVDRRNSYFAITRPLSEADGRRYIGISALGIGPRKVFLRSIVPLLAAAQKQFDADPRDGKENPADPYMTALCYFNALRELGATRRIVEDEVRSNLRTWPKKRLRDGELEADSAFATRVISVPEELTSRLSTDLVAHAKERLAKPFEKNKSRQSLSLDIGLATNMISVGLDITRLGLMLVQNQPKSAAEYIQATSRVGRDSQRPGLVLVVLNMHRARDRAHYEDFSTYHEAFYRAVEATSVTPHSMRAKDRVLGAVFAALIRHLNPELTRSTGAGQFDRTDPNTLEAAAFLKSRFCTQEDIERLMDGWEQVAAAQHGESFHWDTKRADDQGLMHDPLTDLGTLSADFELFRAGWSMRDVQAGVDLEIDDYLEGPQRREGQTRP